MTSWFKGRTYRVLSPSDANVRNDLPADPDVEAAAALQQPEESMPIPASERSDTLEEIDLELYPITPEVKKSSLSRRTGYDVNKPNKLGILAAPRRMFSRLTSNSTQTNPSRAAAQSSSAARTTSSDDVIPEVNLCCLIRWAVFAFFLLCIIFFIFYLLWPSGIQTPVPVTQATELSMDKNISDEGYGEILGQLESSGKAEKLGYYTELIMTQTTELVTQTTESTMDKSISALKDEYRETLKLCLVESGHCKEHDTGRRMDELECRTVADKYAMLYKKQQPISLLKPTKDKVEFCDQFDAFVKSYGFIEKIKGQSRTFSSMGLTVFTDMTTAQRELLEADNPRDEEHIKTYEIPLAANEDIESYDLRLNGKFDANETLSRFIVERAATCGIKWVAQHSLKTWKADKKRITIEQFASLNNAEKDLRDGQMNVATLMKMAQREVSAICSDEELVNGKATHIAKLTGPKQNERNMVKQHLIEKRGPVVIIVPIPEWFFYYTGGVFSKAQCSYSPQNVEYLYGLHPMLIMGFGKVKSGPQAGMLYWIMQPLLSRQFGEDGMFLLEMGACETESAEHYFLMGAKEY